MGANLLALVRLKKKLAAAVVQLDGSVLIWHMLDWFSTAYCLLFIWGTFKKRRDPLLPAAGRPPRPQPPAATDRPGRPGGKELAPVKKKHEPLPLEVGSWKQPSYCKCLLHFVTCCLLQQRQQALQFAGIPGRQCSTVFATRSALGRRPSDFASPLKCVLLQVHGLQALAGRSGRRQRPTTRGG
jgi:hypothetical protein